MRIADKDTLQKVVQQEVANVQITDIHTHLYSKDFDSLLLYGVDELLTYHYLIAEYFRYSTMDYDDFFVLSKREQADLIWKTLFIEHSPVSEAQRGVLTVLDKLGLDVSTRDLDAFRKHISSMSTEEYIDKVFEVAGIKEVVMTNDPFDSLEKPVWDAQGNRDERFKTALRVDPLVVNYEQSYKQLCEWGYDVNQHLDSKSIEEVKRFLRDWVKKIDALYLAVSLPPSFFVPEASNRSRITEQCIIPVCEELGIPFAMMIGVNRAVNPRLRLASDAVEKANIKVVEYLCKTYPNTKFMVTMLSRENQHELAIQARKFRNLMIFGCWWYLNNPMTIEEMTRMRMETLGLSFIPQHSDARVLDQLIYKWEHSRKTIAKVLVDKYSDILDANWTIDENEIKRDINDIFSNNFWSFLNK